MSFSLTFFVLASYVFPGTLFAFLMIPVAFSLWPTLCAWLAAALHLPTVATVGVGCAALASATCLGAAFSDAFLFLARHRFRRQERPNERLATLIRDVEVRESFVYWRLHQLDIDGWAGRIRLTGTTGIAFACSGAIYLALIIFDTPYFQYGLLVAILQILLGLVAFDLGCRRVRQYDCRVAGMAEVLAAPEWREAPLPSASGK